METTTTSASPPPNTNKRSRRERGLAERILRRCGGVVSITMLITWGAYTFWTSTYSVLQATMDFTTMFMDILTCGLFFIGIMSVLCLTTASWKDPGYFPPHRKERMTFRSAIPSFIQTEESSKNNHQLRYCKHCKCSKPDRAYHVKSVGSCVLRLDHFCPMIGAPVAFRNQKQFCLFLIYVVTLCSIVAIINLHCLTHVYESHDLYDIPQELQDSVWWVDGVVYEYRQPSDEETEDSSHPPILIFANKTKLVIEHSTQLSICIATVFVLCYFLVPVQFKNALHNVTQQEDERFEEELLSPRSPDGSVAEVWSKQKYDLGWKRNMMQVFGSNPWQWFLPLTPSHMDLPLAGIEWEVSRKWLNAYELRRNDELNLEVKKKED